MTAGLLKSITFHDTLHLKSLNPHIPKEEYTNTKLNSFFCFLCF